MDHRSCPGAQRAAHGPGARWVCVREGILHLLRFYCSRSSRGVFHLPLQQARPQDRFVPTPCAGVSSSHCDNTMALCVHVPTTHTCRCIHASRGAPAHPSTCKCVRAHPSMHICLCVYTCGHPVDTGTHCMHAWPCTSRHTQAHVHPVHTRRSTCTLCCSQHRHPRARAQPHAHPAAHKNSI